MILVRIRRRLGPLWEIEGVGFQQLDKLFFGDQDVPFEAIDDTRLRAQVPNGSGPVEVTLKWARPFPMSSSRSFNISAQQLTKETRFSEPNALPKD
jgi:hypothetical protein